MAQSSILDLLNFHPFTAALTATHRSVLADMAELSDIEQEQTVFGSGERSRFFYLLVSGTAFLELQTAAYTVCIQQLGPGEAFGWSALVDEPYRAFQVRARVACKVVRISGDRLREACDADHSLGAVVYRQLSSLIARRLRAAETRFEEFCARDSET